MAYRQNPYGGRTRGRRRMTKGGLVVALIFAAFAFIRYCSSTQYNDITGEKQQVALTVDQEIALGLQSRPQMVQQFGGLHPSKEGQLMVTRVGQRLVDNSIVQESDYQYNFFLLADEQTINAFALPGGQVFITAALFGQLENEDQLAGVLGHEIGHVVGRHGAERIAKQQLTEGLTGAAVIASGDYNTAQAAAVIANVVNMSYGRDQELESDNLGIRFMMEAGYDPMQMIGVMDILERAGGSNRQPEFFSTHPSPDNRRERIMEAVEYWKRELNM